MKPAEKTMQGRAEAKEEASADEATRLEDRSDRESSMLSLKLSKDLRELVKAYREKGNPSELTIGKLKVVEGTITVQVMLTGTTENILQKLKDAGMEIQFKASAGKTVIGTISMEKLEEMARIPEVRFVEGVKSR
jgi:hypothetical protein